MTMDGEVELKISAGSQPGDILRIKGKGIKRADFRFEYSSSEWYGWSFRGGNGS